MEYIFKFTHRRPSRITTCTRRELRHYSIFRLYGAVATAYPLPGCPYFVLYFLTVRLLYEGDGISPPRPPGSASRQRSLRADQGCVRFVAPYMLRGLLVDSGRR